MDTCSSLQRRLNALLASSPAPARGGLAFHRFGVRREHFAQPAYPSSRKPRRSRGYPGSAAKISHGADPGSPQSHILRDRWAEMTGGFIGSTVSLAGQKRLGRFFVHRWNHASARAFHREWIAHEIFFVRTTLRGA
jgi:hypothetical protein